MRVMRTTSPIAVAGVVLLAVAGSGPVSGRAADVRRAAAQAPEVLDRSLLSFLPHEGSRFVAHGPGYGIAVAPDEVRVAGPSSPAPLRMRLQGARPHAPGRGEMPRPGRTNLFLGDDPAGWRTDLASYGRVRYADVWDGIDVVYHGRGSQLEQDFVVSPGADAGAISLSFPGAHGLRLAGNGDLVVPLTGGEVRLGRPTLYQEVAGKRRPVTGEFALRGQDRVGFGVGPHDRDRPLVIDPVLLESSYLGGSGNDAAYGVAVDDAGHVYVTGYTESTDFPTASPLHGGLVEEEGVRTDAFVAKLNPEGDGFVYSTFLGGGRRDAGHAIAVAVDGSAVVAGYTESADFPLARPIVGEFAGGTSDAFVARISPEGAVLQYSTYVGGTGTDTARGVAVSQSGDAYLVGSTTSSDFPVAGTPLRGALSRPDDSDAYVTRIDAAGSAFVYSTYLGGSGEDHGLAVALDPVGNAYVTGDTRSPDLPTTNPFQPGLGGGTPEAASAESDAFVSKLDANGSSLLYSTYLGGGESDQGAAIAVDGGGNAYVTGSTGSTDFPVVRPAQPRKSGDFDAFVAKLTPEGPLLWSTYLGGSASDGGGGVAVDGNGRASVTGAVASTDFPTVNPLQDAKSGGFVDGFVVTYDEAGAAVVHSSYLGGDEDDQGTALAVDGEGNLRVAGSTRSSDFRTAKPLQPAKGGDGGDAFVARIGDPPPPPEAQATRSSPARDRRIRFFIGTTVVLFLAAVAQTLWLRRHPPGPAPAPAGVGDLAVTRVGPVTASSAAPRPGPVGADWYAANRPPPPRLRDIAPVAIRPLPPAARRTPKAPTADEPRPDEVTVPDLLPEGDEGPWSAEPVPADAEASASPAEAEGAPAPAPDDVLPPPPPPPPIDVTAPDLWGPSEPDPELADDSVWADLLGADPSELEALTPPPSPPLPPLPPRGRRPAPPSEVVPAGPAGDEAIDGAVADALAAAEPTPAEPPREPPPAEPPPAEPPRAVAEPRPAADDAPAREARASQALPAEPEEPFAAEDPDTAPAPEGGEDVVVEIVVSPADVEPEGEADAEARGKENGDEDWMAALWAPPSRPRRERPEQQADELPTEAGEPGPESPAGDTARASDLSISDLLAEDLPIPEAEERALSIRDLLAEDLAVPEPEAPPHEPPPASDAEPAAESEPPPAAANADALTTGEEAQRPSPEPSAAAEEPPPVTEGEVPPEAAPEEPPSGEEPPAPPPGASRPLPEAAPGRSLGGRLRRAWHSHDRES